MTVTNLVVTQLRQSKLTARETRRLRLALATELEQLCKLQVRNIASLRAGKRIVLSARSCTIVYRSTLSRLVSIPDYALENLVRAYAVVDQAEHMIASTARTNTPAAYRLLDDQAIVDEVVLELEQAEAAIKAAINSMRLAAHAVPVEPGAPDL